MVKFIITSKQSTDYFSAFFFPLAISSDFHWQNQLRSGRAPLIRWIFKTFPAVFALNASMFAVRHGVFAHSGPTGSWPDCGRPKSASAPTLSARCEEESVTSPGWDSLPTKVRRRRNGRRGRVMKLFQSPLIYAAHLTSTPRAFSST